MFLKFLTCSVQDDVAHLVGLSEDIKHARRKRVREIGFERRHPEPRPLAIEDVSRDRRGGPPPGGPWDHEEERYVEREWRSRPPPGRW